VLNEGDGFAALFDQAEKVGEDGRGDVGAKVLELFLPVCEGGSRAELLLGGEKSFDECSHTPVHSHRACRAPARAEKVLKAWEL
jgi:hypothetical protein